MYDNQKLFNVINGETNKSRQMYGQLKLYVTMVQNYYYGNVKEKYMKI